MLFFAPEGAFVQVRDLWDGASAAGLASNATGDRISGSLMPSENVSLFNPPQTETSCAACPLNV